MNFLNSYQRARILLLAGSIVSFVIFWNVGRWFHIPVHPGHEGSLLMQPSPLMSMLVVTAVLGACVAIGTVMAGMIRFNAGLLTATLGLSALSFRAGEGRQTLLWGLSTFGSPTVYLKLMLELMALTLVIGACWWALREMHAAGKLKDREGEPAPDAGNLAARVQEILAQIAITGVIILVLAQSEAKQQALGAVFVGAFAGVAITHSMFNTGARTWHWMAPLVVGIIGYAAAYFSPPAGTATANVQGIFAGLVRPLPLDYASAGPAGAVLGHWMSRRWQKEREAAGQMTGTTQAAG